MANLLTWLDMPPEQILVAVLGTAAIWMSQSSASTWRRWASLVGLAGQPLILWVLWQGDQRGSFLMGLACTVAWCRGAWTFWLQPWWAAREASRPLLWADRLP